MRFNPLLKPNRRTFLAIVTSFLIMPLVRHHPEFGKKTNM